MKNSLSNSRVIFFNLFFCWYLQWHSEKAVAPHSITLAWKIPWTEEPGRLQSMGLLKVGHDLETSLSLFIFLHWRRKWQPTPVFLPGESQGRGSLVGLLSMESHRVGHDWSDLAAAAAAMTLNLAELGTEAAELYSSDLYTQIQLYWIESEFNTDSFWIMIFHWI